MKDLSELLRLKLAGAIFAGLVALVSNSQASPTYGLKFFANYLSFFSQPTSGSIRITVRDSVTGQRLGATLRSTSGDGGGDSAATDQFGEGVLATIGRTDITVEADGYQSLKTYFIADGSSLNTTVWLDPLTVSTQLREGDVGLDDGTSLVHGNIYDERGMAIRNARVFFEGSDQLAVSDDSGYFRLSVPTPSVDPRGDLPGESILNVEKDGKLIHRRSNMMIPAGSVRLIIDAKEDVGSSFDAMHKLRLSREGLMSAQDFQPVDRDSAALPNQPGAVAVPASIRVGSTCPNGRTSCTVFNVYTLDTYVRFGLDDEWISSWNANSLKAGAIAYRSYGAYHVNHPINAANYDICNTTSCQVCDPTDTATSTNNAAIQTTGSIVVNSTQTDVLFAEYSAENNLGGCPDGFTGNNTTWPCLTDPVDAGQAFFGHGRGMCQWGSQRWSINQGKDFVWIVDHYYNANGNPSGLRNGIFQIGPDTLLPPPNLTEPGNVTAPGTTVSILTPTFKWEPIVGADGYSLYVSKFNGSTYDVVFNSETAVGQPIAGTSFTLPAGVLVADGQYRWNMSAHIGAGYGTPNTFRNYFTVTPTALATVSGRVTSPSGLNLRNVAVSITDSQGARRTATTSPFGVYTFTGVAIGQTHTVTASSKRYRFSPQILQINGSLSNLDFVGQE